MQPENGVTAMISNVVVAFPGILVNVEEQIRRLWEVDILRGGEV